MTVTIRTYEPRDAEAVWALHVEAQEELGLPYDIPERDGDLRSIPDAYLRTGSHFWVVEAGGRPIATVAVRREDEEAAQIKRMRVTASHRRQGFGRRLLETAETFCRENGYRRIILDTTHRQEAAQRLYENSGYHRTGERTLDRLGLDAPNPIPGIVIFDYEKDLR
jgi:GNAT superfamily N-acetyltransferase